MTSGSFSFTYGTVEIRAQMPKGDWLWPGIGIDKFTQILFIFKKLNL